MRVVHDARVTGVDFKDFAEADGFEHIEFHRGLFYEQELEQSKKGVRGQNALEDTFVSVHQSGTATHGQRSRGQCNC